MNHEDYNFAVIVFFSIIIFVVLVSGIVMSLFLLQKKNQAYIFNNEQLKAEFRHTLLKSKLEIQEQTLQNVSRELHDNFGQIASLIKINLNTLDLNGNEHLIERIEDTKMLIRSMINDIKLLSISLGSERINKLGLWAALSQEIDLLNKFGTVKVEIFSTKKMPELDANTSVIIYRMSQEIFNNALKHSKAANISLNLSCSDKNITLAFEDDGIGFNLNEINNGSGINNLYNRAKLLGADLLIKSSINEGTSVQIKLDILNDASKFPLPNN